MVKTVKVVRVCVCVCAHAHVCACVRACVWVYVDRERERGGGGGGGEADEEINTQKDRVSEREREKARDCLLLRIRRGYSEDDIEFCSVLIGELIVTNLEFTHSCNMKFLPSFLFFKFFFFKCFIDLSWCMYDREIMCCHFNPQHYLFSCGTKEGTVECWDPRDRTRANVLDITKSKFIENIEWVVKLCPCYSLFFSCLQAVGMTSG